MSDSAYILDKGAGQVTNQCGKQKWKYVCNLGTAGPILIEELQSVKKFKGEFIFKVRNRKKVFTRSQRT